MPQEDPADGKIGPSDAMTQLTNAMA